MTQRLALMLRQNAERFARLRAPSADDCARIAKQILENIDLVPDEHLRAIAGILAPLESTPAEVAHFFCHADAAIAAPFIARSPALDDRILLDIIARYGTGPQARAIARRSQVSGPLRAALRWLDHPAIDRALELRQTQAPVAAGSSPTVVRNAATQRLDDAALSQLAGLAGVRSRPLFETALADCTGLSMTSARILCDDPTSRNFLIALRFMGFDGEQALSVFGGLVHDLADDDAVRDRFRIAYEAITPVEAAERVRGWQLDEIQSLAAAQAPSASTQSNDDTANGAA